MRVLLVTFLLTLFAFAVGLMLGILGTVIAGRLHGVHPDMTSAYRHVALPVAALVGVLAFVSMAVVEIRRYRQVKALAEIERASR